MIGMHYRSKYFAHRSPPSDPVGGIKRPKELRHDKYQIKGNDGCSNMQIHILSLHKPSTPGVGVKCLNNVSLKVAMLHIKLKRMIYRTLCQVESPILKVYR